MNKGQDNIFWIFSFGWGKFHVVVIKDHVFRNKTLCSF